MKKKFVIICLINLFVLIFSCQGSYAQAVGDNKVSLQLKGVSMGTALRQIENQTGYKIEINGPAAVADTSLIYYVATDAPLSDVLFNMLSPRKLRYYIEKGNIIISSAAPIASSRIDSVVKTRKIADTVRPFKSESALAGIVRDSLGRPMSNVTVFIEGANVHTVTDKGGTFRLDNIPPGAVVVFSALGFETERIRFSQIKNLSFIMRVDDKSLLEDVTVVSTGMFTRDKNTFTGATSSFSGDQLRNIGVQNVIQSLKTLDPSFTAVANSMQGSDPNTLANVQIRGGSAVAMNANAVEGSFRNNPNLPLFILNGIEASLQQITDLDINRIGRVTVLKDATSTVLYGNKAANGVVVIETIKPKPGQLRFSYTGSATIQWPDFGSYNFMNAAQNLQFQNAVGIYFNNYNGYPDFFDNSLTNQQVVFPAVDSIYNARLVQVLQGVDNDWKRVPVRRTVELGHSINVFGGDQAFQYSISANYREQPGVMKASGRKTYGASIDLQYQVNRLNVTNSFYLNGFRADQSPYGSFSRYAQISPFFNIFDSLGGLNREPYLYNIVDPPYKSYYMFNQPLQEQISNPLYNAVLPSFSYQTQLGFTDNLNIIYDILPSLRFQAQLGTTFDNSQSPAFTDPRSTQFDRTPALLKGSYSNVWMDTKSYQGSAMLSYYKVFNGIHSINANLRTQLDHSKSTSVGITAVGFPPLPKFSVANAYSYTPDAAPAYTESIANNNQNVFSMNYAYNKKYLFDFSYNMDGTSNFGSERLYRSFLSGGIGWNIANEGFMEPLRSDISILRLTLNYGTSGNQNLGAYPSNTIYNILSGSNSFGLAYQLSQLGSPYLDWQVTRQVNAGLNFEVLNHLFSGYINYYAKLTDPLIIYASLPPSAGVTTNPLNLGKLDTKGFDFTLNVSPIYQPSKNRIWTIGVTGGGFTSKYKDIGNRLEYQNTLNQDAQGDASERSFESDVTPVSVGDFLRFRDGNDPNALWVVRSLGIDPATGTELFLNKDGKGTFIYNPEDAVSVGSTIPKIQGVIFNMLQLGNFSFSIALRYSLNAASINTGLYNYAEKTTYWQLLNNHDVRSFQRWLKPGDVAPFASVIESINNDTYPLSSRFVSHESFLSGESFSIGYQIYDPENRILKSIRAKNLRFTIHMNDIFYFSNKKLERGIGYPYAKSVSVSASVSF